jgi:hypothetical protein
MIITFIQRARHAVEERHPVKIMRAKHTWYSVWTPTYVGVTVEDMT